MIKATITKATSLFLTTVFILVFGATATAQYTITGDNVVANGDFSEESLYAGSDTVNTSVWRFEGDTTMYDVNITNGELAFTNMQETGNQYDYQVNQPFTAEQIAALERGGTFELTFDARTTADEKFIHVFLGQVGGSWARYWPSDGGTGPGDVTVTNTMETYTLTTEITETWEAMRLGFEVSSDTSDLFIDNVSLRFKADNIVFNGDFSYGDSTWAISPGAATVEVVNEELAFTNIPGEGDTYAVQAMHVFGEESLDSLYPGPYRVSFDARASSDSQEVHLYFGELGGGWARYFGESTDGRIALDTTMKTYVLETAIETVYDAMQVGFEVNYAPGDFYVDNIIVSRISDPAPAAPTFSLSSDDNGIVTISVNETAGAATYDVYFADSAFTDSDGGKLVGTIDVENGNTLEHTTAAPHPSVAYDFTAHYGVIAKSEKGTPSDMTNNSIETAMSTAENYAYELSAEAETALLEAYGSGEFPEGSTLASFFPEGYVPFTIDENSIPVVGDEVPPNDDLSAKFWVGFKAESQVGGDILVFYAEVTDDALVFATEADGSGGAWNFDSYEIGIGNYTPESFIQGSQHPNGLRGEEPDWQMRGGGIVDAAGDGSLRGFIHAYTYSTGNIDGEITNAETLIEETDTGYRTLTLITTVNMVDGDDVPFDFPTGAEVDLYPFQIAMNDADETARDHQIAWGSKAVDGGWWDDPTQWNVIAFVGADAVPTSNEDLNADQPMKISLDQNYPNPFNPSTNINFTLPKASKVSLEVFNILGQKVATLVKNESLTAGAHSHTFDASNLSSGLYIYRLKVGSSFTSSKKMMLIK